MFRKTWFLISSFTVASVYCRLQIIT